MEQIDVARMALQRVLVGKAGGIVFRGEACDVVGGRDGLSHGGVEKSEVDAWPRRWPM